MNLPRNRHSRLLRGVLPLLLCLLGGCSVDPGSLEGKACDSAHPCPSPWVCSPAGTCQKTAEVPSPDGGDGSCVTWSQSVHGFESQESCGSGCTLDVDPSGGHRLTARVPGTTDGNDFAYAQVTSDGRMPDTEEGRLRGTFEFSDNSDVREYVPFVVLRTATGQTLIELGLDGRRTLQVRTDPGVLQAGTPTPTTTSQEFRAGAPFTVDVSWKKNGARTVRVNGNEVLQGTVSGGATQTAVPGTLLLGITRNDGDDQSPIQLTLHSFLLCDSATGTLP